MTYNCTNNFTGTLPSTYMEQLWNYILDNTSKRSLHPLIKLFNFIYNILSADSPFLIYCFGVHWLMTILYWSVGSFYIYLDLVNPKWVQKFKIQPGKNEPVDKEELKKVIKFRAGNYFQLFNLLNNKLFI